MTLTLLGLGTARPTGAIDQQDAVTTAETRCCTNAQQQRVLRRMYRQSTVQSRGSVLIDAHTDDSTPTAFGRFYPPPDGNGHARGPDVNQRMDAYSRHALPLAQRAAETALREANVAPRDITQLITVSCTGFAAPGLDVRLIEALGLSPGVGRTMIGFMGCHGAINGLRNTQALAQQSDGPALLCCAELCTLHFQYGWDTQRLVANALFGDGAAAAVGMPSHSDEADNGAWRVRATGSQLVPNTHDAMTWSITDHGFVMTLSPRVPGLIGEYLRPWLTHWLSQHGLRVEDVGSWAIHPGGPRVLDAVAATLSLPDEAVATSRDVLAECGNMSSPTVLFILDRLRARGAAGPCVALAFGPGLMIEAALLI